MVEDGIEKEVLEEIASRLVMSKKELVDFLKEKTKNPISLAEAIAKHLKDEGLITYVIPIGESCLAITQKGMREVGR